MRNIKKIEKHPEIKKHPVTDVLNRGKDRAISRETLMNYFNLTERELKDQIMRERLDGMPILAKKSDGGGYYLPENPEEVDAYLALLKRGINTQTSVYNAIEANRECKNSIVSREA